MSTIARHGFFVAPAATASSAALRGERVQWIWLALVALLATSMLGLGMTRAAAHPGLDAAGPELPVAGSGG